MGLTRARDLIVDSAPILAWRRTDPAVGHAPAHHPRPLLRGYRLHTLLCRGAGLPLLFRLSPANVHDAPFARPLLELAVRLLALRPRVVRLDAGYWGLKLIAWIHTTLHARAVIPWNPKRQKQRDGLPPTWTTEELFKCCTSGGGADAQHLPQARRTHSATIATCSTQLPRRALIHQVNGLTLSHAGET